MPEGTSSANFEVTAIATTGSTKTISIPISSYPCNVANCLICSSADQCTTCSDFSSLDGNECKCQVTNCAKCRSSPCSDCASDYSLLRDKFCIAEDKFAAGTSIASTAAVGVAMASSMASSVLTSASGGNLWNMFNSVQIIEMVALIELNFPDRLEQFFHGYEFALLNTPEQVNAVQIALDEPKRDKPYSDRMDSYGFSSSYFLVQQAALCMLCGGALCLKVVLMILHRCFTRIGCSDNGRMGKCFQFLESQFPGYFFRTSCEFYIPALLAALINSSTADLSWYFAYISVGIANIMFLLCNIYPFLIAKQLYGSSKLMSPEELKKHYPNLLDGLKADKLRHLWF